MAMGNRQLDREILLQIDSNLGYDDLEGLKFLSSAFTQRRPVSMVTRGLQLFDILESANLITSTDFSYLYRMFEIIGRRDLCTMIEANTVIQVDSKPDCLDQIDFKFNEMLFQMSEDMSLEDVDSLRYLFRVPRNKKIKSGIDLFLTLNDLDQLSQTKLETLVDYLKEIGRVDLTHRLSDFKGNFRGQESSKNDGKEGSSEASSCQSSVPTSASSFVQTSHKVHAMESEKTSSFSSETVHKEVAYYSDDILKRLESIKVSDKDQGNGEALCKDKTQKSANTSLGVGLSPMNETAETNTKLPIECTESKVLDSQNNLGSCKLQCNRVPAGGNSLPRYKMNGKPRGICLVIDNHEFAYRPNDVGAKKLNNRRGSDKDVENIKTCFTNLDFDVRVKQNVTDMEMYETFREYALGGKVNEQHDCFVTFILSHGGTDEGTPYLYGTSGHKIHLDKIITLFRADSAPALAGKPKLFFLACCLGRSYSKAIPVQPTGMHQHIQTDAPYTGGDEEMDTGSFVCNDQDFLIGYSTVQGNVSFRDTREGTWYITALTKVISEYRERESLQHMLVEVNRRVANNRLHCANERGQMGHYAQVPSPQHTLTKQLWF